MKNEIGQSAFALEVSPALSRHALVQASQPQRRHSHTPLDVPQVFPSVAVRSASHCHDVLHIRRDRHAALRQDQVGRQSRRVGDQPAQQLPLVLRRAHGAAALGNGRVVATHHGLHTDSQAMRSGLTTAQGRAQHHRGLLQLDSHTLFHHIRLPLLIFGNRLNNA